MTFPTIEATSTYTNESSLSSYSVTLPASIASGDLLLLFIKTADGVIGVNTPTDWTLLLAVNSGTFNSERMYVFTKEATGSEGSTVTVTLGSARRIAAVCYRISGVDHTHIEATNDASLVNDPPSITASWGSADNLFIAAMGNQRSDNGLTTEPTNYGSGISIGHSSNTNDTRCRMTTAHRNYASATDDPGAFTMSGTILDPISFTVVIGPAGAGFSVTDVDLDETVTDGQTGVVIALTGTVAATGKKVFITQGANSVEQTVTAENSSSATITVSYGGVLTAGAATLSVRNPL